MSLKNEILMAQSRLKPVASSSSVRFMKPKAAEGSGDGGGVDGGSMGLEALLRSGLSRKFGAALHDNEDATWGGGDDMTFS